MDDAKEGLCFLRDSLESFRVVNLGDVLLERLYERRFFNTGWTRAMMDETPPCNLPKTRARYRCCRGPSPRGRTDNRPKGIPRWFRWRW